MSQKHQVVGVRAYHHSAGGWGALKATAKAVREQMDVAEAPVLLLKTNKPDGFDCPGCAWPDKEHTSTFQFCENGAKAVTWEATKKRVTPEFFAAHTVTELFDWSDYELENEGRLTHPMAYDRASDTYRPITWEAAFARIGEVLRSLPDPNMAEFYTSGRASNEAAFLFQLFAREYGTNNFPDCSNMCHEATSVGLAAIDRHRQRHGLARGFRPCRADHRHGPQSRHQPSAHDGHAARGRAARRADHRLQPVDASGRWSASPTRRTRSRWRPSARRRIASTYYQVKVGGDARRAEGRHEGAAGDRRPPPAPRSTTTFIAEHTNGFDAFAADLRATDWDDIEAASGLHARRPGSASPRPMRSRTRRIVTYGMGITQHREGHRRTCSRSPTCCCCAAISASRAPASARCAAIPTCRATAPSASPKSRRPSCSTASSGPSASARPPHHGHDAVAAMQAIVDGALEGADLPGRQSGRRAAGSGSAASAGMRKLDLAVHIDTKLNRSHLLIGKEAIILPVPRPHRAGHAGERPAGGDGRGFDVDGARLARQAAARLGASALRAGDRRRHGGRDPAEQQGRLAAPRGRLRPHPRRDRGVLPGLPRLQRAHPRARRLPPAAAADRARLEHAVRQGRVHRLRKAWKRIRSRPSRRRAAS